MGLDFLKKAEQRLLCRILPSRKKKKGTISEHAVVDTQNASNGRHPGFTDLPRELRDKIYAWAFVSKHMDMYTDLVDQSCREHMGLFQVSRAVRSEFLDVYWSRMIPTYQSDWLSSKPALECHNHQTQDSDTHDSGLTRVFRSQSNRWDLDELQAWFSIYGKIVGYRIRRLAITLHPGAGFIDLNLQPHLADKPYEHYISRSEHEQELTAFGRAVLVPDGQLKITFERFVTLCDALTAFGLVLCETRQMMRDSPISSHERIREQRDAELMQILSIER